MTVAEQQYRAAALARKLELAAQRESLSRLLTGGPAMFGGSFTAWSCAVQNAQFKLLALEAYHV